MPPRRREKDTCDFEDCTRRYTHKGLCKAHYNQMMKKQTLRPLRPHTLKEEDVVWRPDKKGYMISRAKSVTQNRRNTAKQHIYVMEQHLGRKLLPNESVHHKNGIKADNRLNNLELWTVPPLKGQRVEDLLDWIIAVYPNKLQQRLQENANNLQKVMGGQTRCYGQS